MYCLCVNITYLVIFSSVLIIAYNINLFELKVLQSVVPIKDKEVILGQYEGYRDDPTVPDNSNTPTFATMVLRIHNERWEGKTPF